jgi:hypothetical protein
MINNFIGHGNRNLMFLGLRMLGIASSCHHSALVMRYQMEIVQCLDDVEDPTIQKEVFT